ncbi:uncharacterized protein L201_002293 [Kwoniella dendrophila CBS 6074]|uniref:Conserved oligomeric Golgi complex subunit 7 n=1 Tax=Kwoniella dendrophila CBS 6074 TaxID=1295534 RepID=A0AAX4JPW0_9TREE
MPLTTPPISTPEPPSTLSSLASTLDESGSDIPSFLNNILSPYLSPSLPPPNPLQPPDLLGIDKSLNELLTQLSLLSQDTNSAVEQSIHDVSRSIPRLAYDLQFMRESANGLSSSLNIVQDRFAKQIDLSSGGGGGGGGGGIAPGRRGSTTIRTIQNDSDNQNHHHDNVTGNDNGLEEGNKTNKSLEKLTNLDKLKNRLESARDILREAESWSTLESEVIGFIKNENDFIKAGNRLNEASKSLIIFEKSASALTSSNSSNLEYEEHKKLLISLQNELEINVSKALINCLSNENENDIDIKNINKFYQIFKNMDREIEFKNYYFKSKSKSILEDYWNSVKILEENDSSSSISNEVSEKPIKFNTFLPEFYSSLLTLLNTEVEQIPQIFPPHTAAAILADFVQTIFDSLDPSFSARISAVNEYHGSAALPELIRSYRATEELGVAIQALIDRVIFNTQGGLLSGDIATSPANVTTNGKTSPGIQSQHHPGPSPTNMARTPSTKKMSISRRFSRAPTISGPQPVDNIWETTLYEPFLDLQTTYATLERRYLENIIRTDPAFQIRPSIGKDISKTFLERVNVLFSKTDEAIGRCLAFTHGYGALGLLSALEAGISTFLDDQRQSVFEQIRTGNENSKTKSSTRDELDFDGLDYSTEDWGSFQIGLHVLESCQEIFNKLTQFENRLEDSLRSIEKVLKSSNNERGYDVKSTTFGSISLLQQSTLNSIDLHSLISSPIQPILPISLNSLKNSLTKSSQLYLQSIILSPLINQLETYPFLQVWNKPDNKPVKKGELQIPTFSLSPTDIISKVSEGLLDLLRVFEIWSKEKSLSFSLNTLPFINNSNNENNPIRGEENIPSSEIVLSTWISSLSLSLLSHLTEETLPSIKNLTMNGQNQLKTDLSYLSNAVGALDVNSLELNKWENAITNLNDENEYRKYLRELRNSDSVNGDDNSIQKEREIVRALGKMRGWA